MTGIPDQNTVLNELLLNFLNHDLIATDEFIKVIDPYLLKLARAKAPELPADLQEEIVNQTYLRLLCLPPGKFDHERGSAKAFLFCVLRNAVQQVRAMYCPPGHPTRDRNTNADLDETDVMSDNNGSVNQDVARVQQTLSLDAEGIEPPAFNGAEVIEISCDVRRILDLASALVATGLDQMYFGGYTLTEAAKNLNVSRFKLDREINAFARQFLHAA